MLENLQGGRASSETRVFDFPAGDVTSNQSPLEFAAAAVTNVFWTINSAHDYFYALGFDESAGNFQTDNFGRGGLDGDAVRGASQAGGGAFSLTRPDGLPIEIAVGLFPSDAASFEAEHVFRSFVQRAANYSRVHPRRRQALGRRAGRNRLFEWRTRWRVGRGLVRLFFRQFHERPGSRIVCGIA